jgi:hypothetical protein
LRDRGAIADKLKEEVGGIQNTATNIGASIGLRWPTPCSSQR